MMLDWIVLWDFVVCLFWAVWVVLILMVFKIFNCLFIALFVIWIIFMLLFVLVIVWFKLFVWECKEFVIVMFDVLLAVLLIFKFEFNFFNEVLSVFWVSVDCICVFIVLIFVLIWKVIVVIFCYKKFKGIFVFGWNYYWLKFEILKGFILKVKFKGVWKWVIIKKIDIKFYWM